MKLRVMVVSMAMAGGFGCATEGALEVEGAQGEVNAVGAAAMPELSVLAASPERPALRRDFSDLPLIEATPYGDGDLCTFSAAAYGHEKTHGVEASRIRDTYFHAIFPDGLVIGSEPALRFTAPEKIAESFPGEGSPAPLTTDLTNPGRTALNTLGAQLGALELNIQFSAGGILGRMALAEASMIGGPFDRYSVGEIAEVAQMAFSGDLEVLEPLGIDLETLNDVIVKINAASIDCSAPSFLEHRAF